MSKSYRELWNRRSLIYSFAISDLKIRYRNSVLGFFWTFLEPLLMLGALYVVFTNIFKYQIEDFPLYILLGLILWYMFARGTTMGLGSLLARKSILTQIYLPKEVLVISSTLTSTFMLCFELIAFGVFMAFFHFIPPATIIILPVILLLEIVLVFGISLPLSVLNARYRDTQFIWSVILQVGFFLTPIFYKSEILPKQFQIILKLNPMAQIINIAHDVAIYNRIPDSNSILPVIITTFLILGIGYLIFRVVEKRVIEEM